MNLSRIAGCFALLAVVCVVAVFFFPAAQGPYSAVHGPVTVFHGARAAAVLRMGVVRAVLFFAWTGMASAVVVIIWMIDWKADARSNSSLRGLGNILRC
jgi:hypothetical protein